MKLVLTPQTLPDVDSFNVIGDLAGSDKPQELVIVSGHLDSWDLATGATDDGAGVAAALGVAHVLRELKLRPKRTLRVIAWMSEEVGAVGGRAYFEANKAAVAQHAAAIESDFGAGKPLGITGYASTEGWQSLRGLRDVLTPLGATAFERSERPTGADISPLQAAGVPGFELLLDGRHYFDYHHTPADTLDKVDPRNVQRMVAVLGVLSYFLLQSPAPLPRAPLITP
jgi:Zn-dependent M28 family amino/carboxypeptidase